MLWVNSVPPGMASRIFTIRLGSSCGLNASYRTIFSADLRTTKVMVSELFPSSGLDGCHDACGARQVKIRYSHQTVISGMTWRLVAVVAHGNIDLKAIGPMAK